MDKMINGMLGVILVEDKNMIIVKKEIVKRSWKERLFTFPWKPFYEYKEITKYIPSKEMIIDENNKTLTAHPNTIQWLKDEFEKMNNNKVSVGLEYKE